MTDIRTELDKILKKAQKTQFSRTRLGRDKKAFFLAGVHFVIDKLLEREQR